MINCYTTEMLKELGTLDDARRLINRVYFNAGCSEHLHFGLDHRKVIIDSTFIGHRTNTKAKQANLEVLQGRKVA